MGRAAVTGDAFDDAVRSVLRVLHVQLGFEDWTWRARPAERGHWARFGRLSTALVRDLAFQAALRAGKREADAAAFAERFLRDHYLDAE